MKDMFVKVHGYSCIEAFEISGLATLKAFLIASMDILVSTMVPHLE
jgi:hypothetical protein